MIASTSAPSMANSTRSPGRGSGGSRHKRPREQCGLDRLDGLPNLRDFQHGLRFAPAQPHQCTAVTPRQCPATPRFIVAITAIGVRPRHKRQSLASKVSHLRCMTGARDDHVTDKGSPASDCIINLQGDRDTRTLRPGESNLAWRRPWKAAAAIAGPRCRPAQPGNMSSRKRNLACLQAEHRDDMSRLVHA